MPFSLWYLVALLCVVCVYHGQLPFCHAADEFNVAVQSEQQLSVLQAEYDQRRAPPQTPKPGMEYSRYPYGRISAMNVAHCAARPAAFGAVPSASTLKVFGVGLSRTGTTSLATALAQLGLQVIHFDADNTYYMPHSNMDSAYTMRGLYDDVDAVFDLPTAPLFHQLLEAYPNALFISSHRPATEWFDSIDNYFHELSESICGQQNGTVSSAADNCFLFTFLNRIHESVYGSVLPNKELWVSRYNAHYDAVRAVIPPAQLLALELSDFGSRDTVTKLCQFIRLQDAECTLTALPRMNTREDMSVSKLKYPAVTRDSTTAKSKYAYATLLADPNANYFKQEFLGAVLVWCESVRLSYAGSPLTYDIILLLMNEVTAEQETSLRKCIDRIIRVEPIGRAPQGMEDTRYNAIIRTKFHVLQLTEYERIIFMDADQMVMRNMDHYFLRTLPAARAPALYALTAMHAPVTTSTFSVRPSHQAFVDIFRLFTLAKWTNSTGWFEYGSFNFNAVSLKVSLRDLMGLSSPWRSAADPDYSFLPVLDQIKWFDAPWVSAPWEFYCSWSDQGMLFYYYFLLTHSGAIIDGSDMDHEVVHFVGIIKPWTLFSTIQLSDANGKFQRWRPAIERWQNIAKGANIQLQHSTADERNNMNWQAKDSATLHKAAVRSVVQQPARALRGNLPASIVLNYAESGYGTTHPHTTPTHTTHAHTTHPAATTHAHTTHAGGNQTHTTHPAHTTHAGGNQTHTTHPAHTTHAAGGNQTHTTHAAGGGGGGGQTHTTHHA